MIRNFFFLIRVHSKSREVYSNQKFPRLDPNVKMFLPYISVFWLFAVFTVIVSQEAEVASNKILLNPLVT